MKLSVKTKIVQFVSGYELCYYSGNWFGFQNLPSDQKSYRTFNFEPQVPERPISTNAESKFVVFVFYLPMYCLE